MASFYMHVPVKTKLLRLGFILFLMLLAPGSVVIAEDFIQGYSTDEQLLKGALVSRTQDQNKVEAATENNNDRLLGVVVRSNESAVTLSSDRAGVYVATSGTQEILASNINGEIKKGDYIVPSAISGVGGHARDAEAQIIGKALQDLDFTDSSNILSVKTVKTTDGQDREVAIGKILVEIEVRTNPGAYGVLGYVPDVVKRVSESVVGKQVAPSRIYASIAVLIISFGLGGSMLYASIRSSIGAIGRNPLAKRSVIRNLTKVIVTSMAIFIGGFVAVYLILTI